jgi:hypothetical protein
MVAANPTNHCHTRSFLTKYPALKQYPPAPIARESRASPIRFAEDYVDCFIVQQVAAQHDKDCQRKSEATAD